MSAAAYFQHSASLSLCQSAAAVSVPLPCSPSNSTSADAKYHPQDRCARDEGASTSRKDDEHKIPVHVIRGSRWRPPGGMDGLSTLSLTAELPQVSPGNGFQSKTVFMYWVDYQVLSSPQSAALIEKALQAVGGRKAGGPPKLDPVTAAKQKLKDYGYMHMDKWDLLWSITAKAMLAAEVLRPGQLVSIIPGFLCITRKTSLIRSLKAVYGEGAFNIVPRTFKLPDEMDEWADWLQQHPELDTGLWMLKNNKQRGTGLRLVHTHEAFGAIWETTTRPGLEGMVLYRWYLAQQYITNPLLIHGCKFGVRVWVLLPDIRPLRVYLHSKGLVLFSSHSYDLATTSSTDGAVAPGHVTNYAQNENGDVWSLDQLKRHLGDSAFCELWAHIQHNTALTFAAALPRVKEVQAQMALPPRSCFQFFGLDFLIDEQLKPWLLEVNATPSMKVEHVDPSTEQLIYAQKWPVIQDMVRMLGIGPQRFNKDCKEHWDLGMLQQELQRRGGFVPLMHLYPDETPDGFRLIPWHAWDQQIRGFTKCKMYKAAAAML